MQPMWFGRVSERAANLLFERGRIVKFKSGAVIVDQGSQAKSFYILLTGQAIIVSLGAAGHEFTRNSLGPGEGYSFMHLYHSDPHSSTLTARSACEVLILSKEDWLKIADACTELKDAVIGIVTHRFRLALEVIDLANSSSSLGRLAHRLLWHVRKTPALNVPDPSGEPYIAVQISQTEIAKMLGVSRQRTNALIQQLEQTGAIAQGYGHILIKDLGLLRKVIADESFVVGHPTKKNMQESS